jgi:hypothetical protein
MYLHKGEFLPTTTFHDSECQKDYVYVDGLTDGMYLSSTTPYLLQQDNGVMVSLDQSFSTIVLHDKNHEVIESINLTFVSTCLHQASVLDETFVAAIPKKEITQSYVVFLVLLFTVILVGFALIKKLHKKT